MCTLSNFSGYCGIVWCWLHIIRYIYHASVLHSRYEVSVPFTVLHWHYHDCKTCFGLALILCCFCTYTMFHCYIRVMMFLCHVSGLYPHYAVSVLCPVLHQHNAVSVPCFSAVSTLLRSYYIFRFSFHIIRLFTCTRLTITSFRSSM